MYDTEVINSDVTINHNTVGNGSTKANIGYRPFESNFSTNGSFQDFFFYSRAVSSNEVVQLYEHLCQPGYSTIDATACNTYNLNGQSYNQSGVYTQTIPKADGCDSIITLNLTIFEFSSAEIVQNGQFLESIHTAENYEWIDCSNQTVIENSNSQQFQPTNSGSYAVVLMNGTAGMCKSTSACFEFTLGLEKDNLQDVILFPNPVSEKLFIQGLEDNARLTIYDGIGRMVFESEFQPFQPHLMLSELVSGTYTVLIKCNDKHMRQQILISK